VSGNEQKIEHQGLSVTLRCKLPFVRLNPRSSRLASFFCCAALVSLPVFALAGTVARVTVPAKFTLSGDKVTLGSLLVLDPADAKLTAELAAVVLAAAPAPGQTKVLPAVEILRRLESVGVTTKTHVIVVPADVAIVREAQTVTPAEISQRVIDEFLPGLRWKEVRLERIDVVETILLPKGKTEWIFNCHQGTDYAKPFYLNINFTVNGEVAKRVFLRTVLSVREHVAVALTELKPDQSIGEGDLRWESQRLLSTLQTPIEASSFFRGRRPRAAIPAGRVLTENLFIAVPLVKRGDSVLLVFESDSMRVTTHAKALTMGFRGQRIQVMNPESGKVLSAEITDEGTARVVQ
jgi:flagella basal body P-ring formation protein FlgA